MIKFLIIFLLGLGIGYAYGFKEGASGQPNIGERILSKTGATRVKKDQEERERAVDAVTAPAHP